LIHRIGSRVPQTGETLFLAWNAEIAGDVRLAQDVSVWFGAVLRGDLQPIIVGRGSNIQDNVTLHVDSVTPCVIGQKVTVGHNAVIHAACVEDQCLIGIGAIIMSRSRIGERSIVGAGSLVTEGKNFPPGSLIYGNPARLVRALTPEEIAGVGATAERYIRVAREARLEYAEVK
jgi:carbonic anhydrase/acetyltransferase-like protein (isoleucine patch superfamily)